MADNVVSYKIDVLDNGMPVIRKLDGSLCRQSGIQGKRPEEIEGIVFYVTFLSYYSQFQFFRPSCP